jgi:hypothetical protein
LLRSAGAETPLVNLDRASEIKSAASRLDLRRARRTVAAIEKTLERLSRNVNPRLATEVLVLDLPRLSGPA